MSNDDLKAIGARMGEQRARIAELEAEVERLRKWEDAAANGHPSPCTLGPLCPYCEIERLRDLAQRTFDAENRAIALASERDRLTQTVASQEKLAEAEDAALLDEIGNRDRLEDQIAAIHVALGGDGEWVARVPPQPPPHSGDLGLDALELAERLAAYRDQVNAAVREAAGTEGGNVVDLIGRLRADAERWKWLRRFLFVSSENQLCIKLNSVGLGLPTGQGKEGDELDAAIDAARAAGGEHGE